MTRWSVANLVTRELLVLIGRPTLEADSHGRFAELIPQVRWERMPALLGRHRLTPLAVNHLTATGMRGHVPGGVWTELVQRAREATLRSFRQATLLGEILNLFERVGIDCLLVKGPAMACPFYENMAHRPCNDLDFLVSEDRYAQALTELQSIGFQPVVDFKADYLPFLIPKMNHLRLRRGGLDLEIHRRLFPRQTQWELPFRHLWKDRRSLSIAANPVWTLGGADTLLYISLHGSKHAWHRLKWVADLVALAPHIRDESFCPAVEKARRMRAETTFLLGWMLIHLDPHTPTPKIVERHLAGQPGLAALARRSMALWMKPESRALSPFSTTRWGARLQETVAGKARVFRHAMFTPSPRDWDVLAWVSPRRTFLFRLIRPLRIGLMLSYRLLSRTGRKRTG